MINGPTQGSQKKRNPDIQISVGHVFDKQYVATDVISVIDGHLRLSQELGSYWKRQCDCRTYRKRGVIENYS